MDDADKMEKFDSTEIKIDKIKKSDKSDDWEFVSEFEADTYQVPFISVPRMHEVNEECGAIASETGMKWDTQENKKSGKIEESMQQKDKDIQEKENVRISSDKLFFNEQIPEKLNARSQMDADFQQEYREDASKLRLEINKNVQDKSIQYGQNQENFKFRREVEEAMLKQLCQYEQEVESRKEVTGIGLKKSQEKQEKEKVTGEINDLQKAFLCEKERENESFLQHGRHFEPDKEVNSSVIKADRLELSSKYPVDTLQEKSYKRLCQELYEAMQDSTNASNAEQYSKSKAHVDEGELLAKAKEAENQAFQSEFPNASAKAEKGYVLESEKNSRVKICSNLNVSFQNEGNDCPLLNEEIKKVCESGKAKKEE